MQQYFEILNSLFQKKKNITNARQIWKIDREQFVTFNGERIDVHFRKSVNEMSTHERIYVVYIHPRVHFCALHRPTTEVTYTLEAPRGC